MRAWRNCVLGKGRVKECVSVREKERESVSAAATVMGPTHRKNSWRSWTLSLPKVEECATRLRIEQLVQRYQTIRPSYETFEMPTCRANLFSKLVKPLQTSEVKWRVFLWCTMTSSRKERARISQKNESGNKKAAIFVYFSWDMKSKKILKICIFNWKDYQRLTCFKKSSNEIIKSRSVVLLDSLVVCV